MFVAELPEADLGFTKFGVQIRCKAIATGVEKRATAKVARPRRQMPKDVEVERHGPGCPPPHRLGGRGSVVSSLSSFRAEPRPKTSFGAF